MFITELFYNSQDLKTIQIVQWQKNQASVIHTMENYSARRERKPAMCNNKEEAGGQYSKLNKSDTETFNYYLIPFVYGILKGQRREVSKIAE